MASFLNPNNPPQPCIGVYGWFLTLPEGARCLYIGQAGRKVSANENGTLLRGVTELFRASFSTDSPDYRRLDTDFVVGTAIRFYEGKAIPVFWEHLSNDPREEDRLFREYRPLIQRSDVCQILPSLKIEMKEKHYWKLRGSNLERRKSGRGYVRPRHD